MNLVQASRLNDEYEKKSNPFSFNQRPIPSRTDTVSKSVNNDKNKNDYFKIAKSYKIINYK